METELLLWPTWVVRSHDEDHGVDELLWKFVGLRNPHLTRWTSLEEKNGRLGDGVSCMTITSKTHVSLESVVR